MASLYSDPLKAISYQLNQPKGTNMKRLAIVMVVFCFLLMATGAARSENRAAIPPNGTLTDTSTGLVWLQNANCFGQQTWTQAMSSVASLASGACGLMDRSTAGQWRLPTTQELSNKRNNRAGFIKQEYSYWASTPYADPSLAYYVGMGDGYFYLLGKNEAGGYVYVWPVRSAQ
jgi:hypothetical protein